MAKKRKVIEPPVLVHYVRVGGLTKFRKKHKPQHVTSVFVIAWDPDGKVSSAELAQQWVAEDRYGLAGRGFQVVGRYRLSQLGQRQATVEEQAITVRLPESGCYECAQWLYVEDPGDD